MFFPVFNVPVLSRSEVVLSSPQSYINICHGLKCLSVVFVRLFEQAEQRSFVPPIMMIERNFTCSNKKMNMYKNSIQRNKWTFGSPACQKM